MGTLNILGKEGDLGYSWNPVNPDEVRNGEQLFNEMMKHGYLAFEADGEVNEQVRAFNPKAKNIIMAPRLVGG